jgi:DNA-directed RNA polymerase specialized sigma24 family protein
MEREFFATTHWTAVLTAGGQKSPAADMALEELCGTYWYPLYAYLRRQGKTREDAEDLTQAFFARFLAKNYLEGLSSEKGKFRAFLLASLKHFLANQWDYDNRLKRGGGVPLLSLDWQTADERYQFDPADNLSPDKLFDRAWAVTLLERVITRLRTENETDDKAKQFDALKQFLMVGKGAIPYAQAAVELNLTEGSIRVAVHRLRRRYRELLREEISQTLSDTTQVEEEIRALFGAFDSM